MTILLWLTIGFIIIGFTTLFSMKKGMENKVKILKETEENKESAQALAKPVIWWVRGATIWGVISIVLVVWTISVYQ